MNQPTPQRFRLHFAKQQAVKYIGHLDLMLAWERALRRARVPLAYSKGFNPRPKMQAASSLPLGTTGTAEILDITLTDATMPDEILARIQTKLPSGIVLHQIDEVPLKEPALQERLRQAIYSVVVETELPIDKLNEAMQKLLAAEEIWQTRRRRKRTENVNIKPWLHALTLKSKVDSDAHFEMRLSCGQHGNLRPELVLNALELADSWYTIERTQLIFEDDG